MTMRAMVRTGRWLGFSALAVIVTLATLLVIPQAARAADDEPEVTTYTRVELWQVKRASWDRFVEMFEQNDKPILEKLMADGAITEWGIDSQVLHSPDGYTHSVWYSAESFGALAKAGEAYEAAWKAMDKKSTANLDAEFAAMITKHRDYEIDTDNMRSVAGTFDGGYYHGQFVIVKPNKDRGFHSYWENRVKPVFESLLEKGVVKAYGMSTEKITTDNPSAHWWWYVVGDADGLDAVEAAVDASWDELDSEGRRERWAGLMDVIEEGSYHEDMTSIIHWSIKAH